MNATPTGRYVTVSSKKRKSPEENGKARDIPAIRTRNLTKVYEGARASQDVRALTDLNLEVRPGEIYGYLGPNGSGKTTTIKMILGLIFPTSGHVEVFGDRDIGSVRVKKRIGYLPEGAYYPDFLRGEEILKYYGRLYGLGGRELDARVNAVMDQVGITHARKRLLRSYSKGMRQRIGLAQALISDPDILILDEPTTGLDPIARKEIRDILAALRDAGKTLLISSHELLEVELICDRVGILFEGVLQRQGTLAELLEARDLQVEVDGWNPDLADKASERGVTIEDVVGSRARLRMPRGTDAEAAVGLCRELKLNVSSIMPRRETLEELFVRVVKSAREESLAATAPAGDGAR